MTKQKYFGTGTYKAKNPYRKKEKSKEKSYKSYFFSALKQKLNGENSYKKKEKSKGKYQ